MLLSLAYNINPSFKTKKRRDHFPDAWRNGRFHRRPDFCTLVTKINSSSCLDMTAVILCFKKDRKYNISINIYIMRETMVRPTKIWQREKYGYIANILRHGGTLTIGLNRKYLQAWQYNWKTNFWLAIKDNRQPPSRVWWHLKTLGFNHETA